MREHLAILEALKVPAARVKRPEELANLQGLILPGGESTTIGNLMKYYGIDEAIRQRHREGMAVFGTCAGLILMAREIAGSSQPRLGLMDITAARNAFGRQIQSFETDLPVPALGREPLRAVFIRAPYIAEAGHSVETLASFNGRVVFARQGKLLAAAFHPELAGETRAHRFFLDVALGRA